MARLSKHSRITKPPEKRRGELLSTASGLFAEQGFSRTTVSDIVKALGVAQGTFYYYFQSKEEIFLTIFETKLKDWAGRLSLLVEDSHLKALPRLNTLIAGLLSENRRWEEDPLLKELHRPENFGLHQKVSAKTVKVLAPLFTTVIEQGINEGIFGISHPREAAEFALSGTLFWLDPLIFDWTREELEARIRTLPRLLEEVLGIRAGCIVIPNYSPEQPRGG